MDKKIGLIGAGNMGTPIVKGIIASGLVSPSNINIFDISREKAAALCSETGANLMKDNSELAVKSDILIIAVKPAYVASALEECRASLDPTKIVVSIAVGISLATLKSSIGDKIPVVRTMPNLPLLVGEGMTLLCFDNLIDEAGKKEVRQLFECSGKAEELDEKLMSEVTALTGSSPAYVAIFIEAMADAAVLSGIPRELSYKLAAQAVMGTARMIVETGMSPAALKDQVCSPAGTTIEAVQALEKNGFRYAVMDAMNECTKRAREIGKPKQ
ncbi:MAG: pyrroline-5-carboxylate reductase [Clostridiales bacterium]|nr:pyrroline-5-carboxylate reductase [Clostridiales bacterium]